MTDWKSDEEVNMEAERKLAKYIWAEAERWGRLPGLGIPVETPLTSEQVIRGCRNWDMPPEECDIDFDPVRVHIARYRAALKNARDAFWDGIAREMSKDDTVKLYELLHPANRVDIALYALLSPEQALTAQRRRWLAECESMGVAGVDDKTS